MTEKIQNNKTGLSGSKNTPPSSVTLLDSFKKITSFDPSAVDEFQTGVMTRDIYAVQRALEKGVSPDTPMRSGQHGLYALLYDVVDGDHGYVANELFPKGMSDTDFRKETTRIVDLLLSRTSSLSDRQQYATNYHNVLTDHLLGSRHLTELSSVILRTLEQNFKREGRAYHPDIENYVMDSVKKAGRRGATDAVEAISDSLRQFNAVHEIVRKRLLNPQTSAEADLVRNNPGRMNFWTEPFRAPSIESFLDILSRGARRDAGGPQRGASGRPAGASPAEGKGPAGQKPESKSDMAKYVTELEKKTPEEVLEKIGRVTGLGGYKEKLETDAYKEAFNAARLAHGINIPQKTMHMALTGNPGVGKTMLARLDAEYLYAQGKCGPRYAEISRTKLMSGHIGGTDINIKELIEMADVIFVDEAPQLVSATGQKGDKQDFGFRVLDALIPALENQRDNKIFIFAGYPEEMDKFLDSDKGLRSRIGRYYQMDDYSIEDLAKIMDGQLSDNGLKIDEDAKKYVVEQLKEAKKKLGDKHFGNARVTRTIVESLPDIMAMRLFKRNKEDMLGGVAAVPSKDELMTVTLEDVKKLDVAEVTGLKARAKATASGGGGISFGAKASA